MNEKQRSFCAAVYNPARSAVGPCDVSKRRGSRQDVTIALLDRSSGISCAGLGGVDLVSA